MNILNSNYLYFTVICLLLLSSCDSDNDLAKDSFALAEQVENTVDNPKRIPADSPVFGLAMSDDTDWQDYDEYYQNSLAAEREAPYYSNLQWLTISQLVKSENFADQASKGLKEFYLKEVFDRAYINDPEVVDILLNGLEATKPESEIAEYARRVETTNKAFLTADNFVKHRDKHAKVYTQLNLKGYDRWAKER